MSKLLNLVRRAPKRSAAILIAAAAAVIVPATLLAWGPTNRPTFTEQVPASYVTFNSITNNSFYGDERYFTTIKDSSDTSNGNWQDSLTAQPGHTYTVRMYVHNNAASNLNLVARNVRASVNVPTTTGKNVSIQSTISADNSNPAKVWDDVSLTSNKDFNLAYVPGSATYYNNKMEGAQLPDSIVTSTGAQLGYDKLDGNIPGCYEYSGYVYFQVKPQFANQTPDFTITKQVRKDTDSTYQKSVTVNPGDTVYYRMQVKNTGNADLDNINLKDQLPNGVSMIPGTVQFANGSHPDGAKLDGGDNITGSGVNVGSYSPGSNVLVAFEAKVADNDNLPVCGPNTLTNTAIATPEGQNPKQDTADVIVNRTCAPGKINVCDLTSRQVVVINESDFDSSKYSKNLADCTSVPTELPQTGIDTGIAAFAGIGALTAGLGYALTSTKLRKLLQR